MVMLFYEAVTVSLTSMPNVKLVEEKIKDANTTELSSIAVMEIQIKTINYRLPF